MHLILLVRRPPWSLMHYESLSWTLSSLYVNLEVIRSISLHMHVYEGLQVVISLPPVTI